MNTPIEQSYILTEIKNLSELEFAALLKEMGDHIYKNKWDHIINECFDIDTFERALDNLQEEHDNLVDEKVEIEEERDRLLGQLRKIKEILS